MSLVYVAINHSVCGDATTGSNTISCHHSKMRRFLGANNQTANLLAAVGCNCVPIVDVRVLVQKQIDEATPPRCLRSALLTVAQIFKKTMRVLGDFFNSFSCNTSLHRA